MYYEDEKMTDEEMIRRLQQLGLLPRFQRELIRLLNIKKRRPAVCLPDSLQVAQQPGRMDFASVVDLEEWKKAHER